jgi:DHA1 family tetracycline resistance protein-like MFS transporter
MLRTYVFVKLLPILGITFIDILGFSILIPLMPYFVKHFGAPDIVVGALFAVFALCQFVGGPFWGNVSDRIGRKAVLIVSQIGATIGWTMLAFAPNIGIVFLARIIEGFSGGNISVTQAYVSDLVEPEKRGRAFAYIGAAFSSGLIFGPLAGGYLVAKYGFSMPFLLAAGLQVVTLIVTILVLPESRQAKADEKPATLGDIKLSLFDPRVAPIMWQKLVFSLGLYGWFSVFTLVLQAQFGFDAVNASYFFCVFGLTSVIFQVGVVGRMTDALGDRVSSNIGFVVLLVGFAIVPFAHTLPLAVVMVAFFSLGLSLVNATIPSLLSANAPDNMRGTILGAASSLESVSGVFMPVLTTYVLQVSGVAPTVAITFGLTTAALIMGLSAMRQAPVAVVSDNEN